MLARVGRGLLNHPIWTIVCAWFAFSAVSAIADSQPSAPEPKLSTRADIQQTLRGLHAQSIRDRLFRLGLDENAAPIASFQCTRIARKRYRCVAKVARTDAARRAIRDIAVYRATSIKPGDFGFRRVR